MHLWEIQQNIWDVVKIWRLKGRPTIIDHGVNIQHDVMGTKGSLDVAPIMICIILLFLFHKKDSKPPKFISGGEILSLRGHSSTAYDLVFSANNDMC